MNHRGTEAQLEALNRLETPHHRVQPAEVGIEPVAENARGLEQLVEAGADHAIRETPAQSAQAIVAGGHPIAGIGDQGGAGRERDDLPGATGNYLLPVDGIV